jgi:hypothetical protein
MSKFSGTITPTRPQPDAPAYSPAPRIHGRLSTGPSPGAARDRMAAELSEDPGVQIGEGMIRPGRPPTRKREFARGGSAGVNAPIFNKRAPQQRRRKG